MWVILIYSSPCLPKINKTCIYVCIDLQRRDHQEKWLYHLFLVKNIRAVFSKPEVELTIIMIKDKKVSLSKANKIQTLLRNTQ